MTNPINFLPGFEGVQTPSSENALWAYLQSQAPETFQDIAQSSSPEILEILGHNIRSLVGSLPPEQFGVQIMTSRDSLARMLSGAMMGGYFLRVMEQRLQLEQAMGEFKRNAPLPDSTQPDRSDLVGDSLSGLTEDSI